MRTPIRRTRPMFEFVQVPNLVARDYRLSWRARGLLVELLSYPPGWETTVDDMVDRAKKEADKHGGKVEGREAMRTAANELVRFGYIKRRKYQDERGRWRTDSELSEEPLLAFMLQETLAPGGTGAQNHVSGATCGNAAFGAGQTEDGKPGVGFPAVGFLGGLTKTESNTETNNTDAAPSARSAPDVRRTGAGSSGSTSGGFAASSNSKPRLSQEQKRLVQTVRDLLPRDLDRALPVKTPRNLADGILDGLAVGQPHERTPEQLLEFRVMRRWNGYWSAKFYAGELKRQPLGPLLAMLEHQQECGDGSCEDRVDIHTGGPCRSCEGRREDRAADRRAQEPGERAAKAEPLSEASDTVPAPRQGPRPVCPECERPIKPGCQPGLCTECRGEAAYTN